MPFTRSYKTLCWVFVTTFCSVLVIRFFCFCFFLPVLICAYLIDFSRNCQFVIDGLRLYFHSGLNFSQIGLWSICSSRPTLKHSFIYVFSCHLAFICKEQSHHPTIVPSHHLSMFWKRYEIMELAPQGTLEYPASWSLLHS